MTSDTPGSGGAGWGQPPNPSGQQPITGEWPAELVPPAPAPAPEPAAQVPGTWGQPAPAPVVPEPVAPAPVIADDAPTQPVAPAWGQPAPAPVPAPTTPAPATPEPASAAPAPAPAGQWGAPPPQQPLQPPPQQPDHGTLVPPVAVPAGQWGAPPPQQPLQGGGWSPPPVVPGGAPAGWQPAPAKSSNGCLKACLIVGIILVILAVIFVVAITLLGMKFASDMGVNPDGTMQQCEFVSNDELAQVLDGQPTGMPLGGFVDATLGQLLDKRLLADARDCWLVDESSSSGYTGRMALQEGGHFEQEMGTAEAGGFYAAAISGFGDQAFCTGIAETGSTGALVSQGGNVAYVSLIAGDTEGFDFSEAPNGVLYSAATCEQAAAIAAQILR